MHNFFSRSYGPRTIWDVTHTKQLFDTLWSHLCVESEKVTLRRQRVESAYGGRGTWAAW